MCSADEIYDTAELDNIPSIPGQHFTDIDIDDIKDEDEDVDQGDHIDGDHQTTDHSDTDLEPSDDFGGSFPLSVEYDDDQPEPTYIDHDDDDWF